MDIHIIMKGGKVRQHDICADTFRTHPDDLCITLSAAKIYFANSDDMWQADRYLRNGLSSYNKETYLCNVIRFEEVAEMKELVYGRTDCTCRVL
jgi:hypothetical protein